MFVEGAGQVGKSSACPILIYSTHLLTLLPLIGSHVVMADVVKGNNFLKCNNGCKLPW